VILVRHAMPITDPHVPHDQWSLTPEARQATRALGLPHGQRILTSNELKAIQTAEELGGTITIDPRIRETHRPYEWRDDFRHRARAYIQGTQHEGWEPHEHLIARFDAAIREHRPEIVVTHGQVMTLWLASQGAIDDPATFWEGLEFPDTYEHTFV
jgi:hypothetical protein